MNDQSTTTLPIGVAAGRSRKSLAWNGGTDLGLLLLRVAVGGPFIAHGLQKIFGLWAGPGPAGFARVLDGYGYLHTTALSWATGLTELLGGALVVLGLITPLAATGLLAIMINTIPVNGGSGYFPGPGAAGVELNIILGLAAAALVLTGPGRIALDNGRVWHRRPASCGLLCLAFGVASALGVQTLLHR